MLAAKSIAYSTGASGIIAAKLMQRLGIAEQLKDKIRLVDGVPVAEIVAKGGAEIGMQQINVILPVAGAEYVGPLPAELQGDVDFAVGVLAVSQHREAAQALVKFTSSPEPRPGVITDSLRRRSASTQHYVLSGRRPNGERVPIRHQAERVSRLGRSVFLMGRLGGGPAHNVHLRDIDMDPSHIIIGAICSI